MLLIMKQRIQSEHRPTGLTTTNPKAPSKPTLPSTTNYLTESITTKKMPISDQEFMTDPKSPLKKSYL